MDKDSDMQWEQSDKQWRKTPEHTAAIWKEISTQIHWPCEIKRKPERIWGIQNQLQLKFTTDKERYNTEHKKIAYTVSSLKGFLPQMDTATGTFQHTTFTAFFNDLKAAYDDADARRTAERKLMELKQNNKDCASYDTTFRTYATLCNRVRNCIRFTRLDPPRTLKWVRFSALRPDPRACLSMLYTFTPIERVTQPGYYVFFTHKNILWKIILLQIVIISSL